MNDLENIPVSELNLGVRGIRRLNELGVTNIGDLLFYDVEDILGDNFGRGSLEELKRELSEYDVELKTRRQREHERICDAIVKAKEKGVDSQTLMAKILGQDIYKLRHHAEKADIELPKGKRGVKPKVIPERDRDITEGLSFSEYAEMWNMSRQGATSYIKHPSRYEIWQNARVERLERAREWKALEKEEAVKREEGKQRFLFAAYDRAKEIGAWAYQRAVEYCILTNGMTSIPFNNLLTLFENYQDMYEGIEELNYLKLAKKSSIKRETVKKVIKTVEPWLETD
ncbi:hypothetical protein HYV88_06425 [Candidatus Woesearchaeota archaeon]|nr:hypothetical protein [Candidatus Woesearchaeota archaeon]